NWPVRATQFGYAFANQFELPVLFYVLTTLEIMTRHADLLFVILAWIFVVMRILQAMVHVTSNNVGVRGAFYGVGALVLLIMWVIYIVRIVLALPCRLRHDLPPRSKSSLPSKKSAGQPPMRSGPGV